MADTVVEIVKGPVAQTTVNNISTLMPNRKILFAIGMALLILLVFVAIALLNQFVLDPANKIDLNARDFLLPFVPVAVGYATSPAANEGTAP